MHPEQGCPSIDGGGDVTQAQGYIWVYSELGKGTTFKIYLPRVTGSAQPMPPPHPTASIAYGTEHILMVEDNPDVLATTVALLNSLGYTVLTATTPKEAIRVAQAHPIDLLVTDVVLLQMQGVRSVRAHLRDFEQEFART